MDQYIWHDNTNDPYILETITFYNKLWGQMCCM